MKNKQYQISKWLFIGLAVVAIFIAAFWPTNYYIESPGQVFKVSDFVKTNQKKDPNLNLVTVSVTSRPAVLAQYLWSYTKPYESRISSKELLGNQSNDQYEELQNWYMETSQQNAIYYAAKRAGLKPSLKYFGVYVMSVQPNSTFKNKLQIGDTILGVDNYSFKSTTQLMDYLNRQKLGSKVLVNVLRNNKIKKKFIGKIVKLKDTRRKGIGIQLVERVKVKTKPSLKINAGEIGGPSAGLMFTLESYAIFKHENLGHGRKIAGTGTIDANGNVGIIGGVDKKVVAASRAGAKIFFAPTDSTGVKKSETNYRVAQRTVRKIHSKMKVIPVKNFDDALNYLKNKKVKRFR